MHGWWAPSTCTTCCARAWCSEPNVVSEAILERASRVRLLTCDVDGVLTDGRIYVDDDGRETKAFHALDGVGLSLLARAGIVVAWITGSPAPAVLHRARRLGVRHVLQDVHDKLAAWHALRQELGLAPQACAHIGDDLPDIPVLALAGLAITVPHAPAVVQAQAHLVTTREGGSGAVREVADLLLVAQGRLEAVAGDVARGAAGAQS
jgi:3-deoxy-D-manno-octulosonate 8-phosphate phosphatase (KDO 8-P phosphatase)